MTDRHYDKRAPARDRMMIDDRDNCRLAVENGKGTWAGSVSDTDPASQISTKANKQPSALPIWEKKSRQKDEHARMGERHRWSTRSTMRRSSRNLVFRMRDQSDQIWSHYYESSSVICGPLLLPPAHFLLGIPIRQLERGPPFGRALPERCARRDVLFYAQNLQPSNYREASPPRGPRSSGLRNSLVGYCITLGR
jgi:hypothetical protein